MKILVTGSSGFIGKEVVKHLSRKHTIIEYDIVNGKDLLNYTQLKRAMNGCDMVVHLAAIPAPVEGKTFADYFANNIIGTYNVAQAALETKVKRVVFTSSTTYYGIERGIPFIKPIKENNPVLTQFGTVSNLTCRECDIGYSTSKVACEQILANYGLTKKYEVIILRIGPVRDRGVNKPFLGIQVSIDNVLQAIELAINIKKKIWYDAFTILDKNIKIADISKAKRLLKYKPQ